MTYWRRLRSLLRPTRDVGEAVDEELRFHIEGRVEELVQHGSTPNDARREVLERFGDYAAVEAACRKYSEQRLEREGWRMRTESIWRDLRFGLRGMRRNPGFTAVVVLTLAVGVGATTAIFTIVNDVLLKPLPYGEPNELVMVWQNDRATGTVREAAATADYFDFVERSRSFDDLAMFANGLATWTRPDGEPRRLTTAAVWHNLSHVLGRDLQVGPGITPEHTVPGSAPVAVLSDRMWKNDFAADPAILGKTILLNEVPVEVVGVLPAGLDFPTRAVDVWTALRVSPATAARNPHNVRVVARLADGVSAKRAHTEMVRIAAELEAEVPANVNRGAFVEPLGDYLRGDLSTTLWALFGAVFAVLMIACGNAANLLLARGTSRARETAIHAALGSGSGRIARKFAVEGTMIAAMSALLGMAIAVAGTDALMGLAPAELDALADPAVDLRVLGFTAALTLLIGLGFGLVPTLQARRLDIVSNLKDGDGRDGGGLSSKMLPRRLLVAGQLAMAMVLLVSAGLLIGTLRNLQKVDLGFDARDLVRMTFQLPNTRYPQDFSTYPDWPEVNAFYREALEEVEAVPGVSSVALVIDHPLSAGWTNGFGVEGQAFDPDQGEMSTRLVSRGYLETAGLELVAGRFIAESDGRGEPLVLVLNRMAAERYFPEGNALGSRITFWGPDLWREVIGIVEDERIHGLVADAPPTMYANILQHPPRGGPATLMVRTSTDPESAIAPVQNAIWGIDRDLPIFDVSTMEATVREAIGRERFASMVLIVFSLVAVLLSVLGVHGVLSYQVARRHREVGVRIALGASRNDVLGMIVRQGMAMTILGLVLGSGLALASTRLIEGLLFGITPSHPLTYVLVAITLAFAAMIGCLAPAGRATRIDPMASIRGD